MSDRVQKAEALLEAATHDKNHPPRVTFPYTNRSSGIAKAAEKIFLKDFPSLAICTCNRYYLVGDQLGGFKTYPPSGRLFFKDRYSRKSGRSKTFEQG